MKCENRFYICKHCGNMVGMIFSSGVEIICCGEPMTELTVNTVDASQEKHVPQIKVEGNLVTVEVGSEEHPMVEKHYIQWIYLQTSQGGHRKCLLPGEAPRAEFAMTDGEKPLGAFEYCNLHGLWYSEV